MCSVVSWLFDSSNRRSNVIQGADPACRIVDLSHASEAVILDVLEIVETRSLHDIDEQVSAGKGFAVTHAKVVFSVLLLRHARAADGMLFFRLGGA